MGNYTIYHLHSDMSNGVTNIDSVTKYQSYIERAKECGMSALGFSEHGSVFAWDLKKEDIEKAGTTRTNQSVPKTKPFNIGKIFIMFFCDFNCFIGHKLL